MKNGFVPAVIAGAALVFVAVSATMNALFLSSLGRTSVEVALLAAVSVTADVVKVVLPVVVGLALRRHAWGQGLAAALLLAVVVALSVTSGIGFAAMTRGKTTAVHETNTERLNTAKRDLAALEAQITPLAAARPVAVIDADLDRRAVDRRWQASKSCSDVAGAAVRSFCDGVLGLRAERAAAAGRDDFVSRRDRLRVSVDAMARVNDGTDTDPQASVLAEVLGVDRKWPRVAVTTGLALLLELGSIILVLLTFSTSLDNRPTPSIAKEPPLPAAPLAAPVPVAKDRAYWLKQRNHRMVAAERGDDVR